MFAVKQKQWVAYLRQCFSGNYWISKRRVTWDLRYYLFKSLFIWEELLGWERAGRPTTKHSITNLLRRNTYFIVGIIDKAQYISRCYIFIHVILIRISSNTPPSRSKSGIPDSLSSPGMIYGVAYLVHNRQRMHPSKSKVRIKFHIL